MKHIKSISWFLEVSMFMFGILKFVDPFKGWYSVQVTNSELGDLSYAMGIMGEITVGIILIFSLLFQNKISARFYSFLIIPSSAVIMVMMATGIYVHLHPAVPAEVHPLKIKPPYIPATFFLLALLNAYFTIKDKASHLFLKKIDNHQFR